MQLNDMILVSTDDHVIEPPTLFDAHVPERLRDIAPRVVRKEDGSDVWVFEGAEIPNIALNAVAGRDPSEYGLEPTSFEDIREGTWNVHERVRDMSVNGVLGSMCFPSMTGFCGQLFTRAKDKETSIDLLRAYNDWHIDEWCGSYPDRFIPLAVSPAWDPQLMADEVHRVAKKGCHAVTFSENPAKLGWPSFHTDYWDPFWKACSEEQTIVALHIGSSSAMITTATDAPVDVTFSLTPLNSALALADLIWSPVVRKWPDLRFALSEGNIGWVPYLMERIDYVFEQHHSWTGQDFGGKKPSELILERFIFCYIHDQVGIKLVPDMNPDNIGWECDYPHSDSTWPRSPELTNGAFVNAGLGDDWINKITHENAMRFFQYDPFAIRPKERCTVGALRAEVGDVDLVTVSRTTGQIKAPTKVTIGDVQKHVERVSATTHA